MNTSMSIYREMRLVKATNCSDVAEGLPVVHMQQLHVGIDLIWPPSTGAPFLQMDVELLHGRRRIAKHV